MKLRLALAFVLLLVYKKLLVFGLVRLKFEKPTQFPVEGSGMDDSNEDFHMDVGTEDDDEIPESQEGNETNGSTRSTNIMDIETIDIDSDEDDDYHPPTTDDNVPIVEPTFVSIPLPVQNAGSVSTVLTKSTTAGSVAAFWNNFIPPSFQSDTSTNQRSARGSARMVSKDLKVFSVAMLSSPKPELENGGKIILPSSLLQRLMQGQADIVTPMLFKVTHLKTKKVTHGGVLEFTAEEGRCYMPFWRMHNIGANEGDVITVESTTAGIGKYALFEPQSVDFLDITNPTALLENVLRNFACITKGEIIVIRYNNRIYELQVLETKPTDVINIIQCDLDVDFAPAVGLPKEKGNGEIIDTQNEPELSGQVGFVPFSGQGSRLNGKPIEVQSRTSVPVRRDQPDFDWRIGTLNFIRKTRPPSVGRS